MARPQTEHASSASDGNVYQYSHLFVLVFGFFSLALIPKLMTSMLLMSYGEWRTRTDNPTSSFCLLWRLEAFGLRTFTATKQVQNHNNLKHIYWPRLFSFVFVLFYNFRGMMTNSFFHLSLILRMFHSVMWKLDGSIVWPFILQHTF